MLPVIFIIVIVLSNRYISADDSKSSCTIINTLPGYPGTLPFNLETGYIGVGEDEVVQLFYYFIESESDPAKDPLIFWHTGGPGCSGFSGLAYEIGPLSFDVDGFDGSFPSLLLNSYSWTKFASIIFIDSPVGTGFSYATTSDGYVSSDTEATQDNYTFLRKWLLNHPQFIKNKLYIAGDSYAGKTVPMLTLEIDKGNIAGIEPKMMIKGYMIGNPLNDLKKDYNERIPYAHRMALISDEYFELAKRSCDGEYINPDPNNYKCLYALELINQCTKLIHKAHILESHCKVSSPKPEAAKLGGMMNTKEDFSADLLLLPKQEEIWCRTHNYIPVYFWANNETVQEALGIRKRMINDWKRCNKTLDAYMQDVESAQNYHQLLNTKGYQVLAYSGDHDLTLPYMSTLKWIRELNLTVDDPWRPWTVDGQVAGYTEKYKNNDAYITFATVKGAGHTAPEYKPKEAFAMAKRWLTESFL